VVAKADALRLTLRERATDTDRLARLPEATVADLEQARLFEITTPRRYGGLQLDVRTFMDAMVALGRGDGSVSWVATLVNINNWFVATLFPQTSAKRFSQSPARGSQQCCSLVAAKCTELMAGTIIEEGVWPFDSGV